MGQVNIATDDQACDVRGYWFKAIVFFSCLFLPVSLVAQPITKERWQSVWRDTTQADTVRLQTIDLLIRKSYWRTEPDSAFLLANAQKKFAQNISDHYWTARATQNIGDLQLRQSDYPTALINLTEAQQGYERIDRWYRAGQAAKSRGNTLRKLGRTPEALEVLLTSLVFHEKAGPRGDRGRAATLNSLGSLYLYQEDFERAAERYEASLVLHRKTNSSAGIAANLNNLSKVYTVWGKYSTAQQYLAQSLIIKQRRNDLEGIANTYKNRGDIFLLTQQYDSANLYYERALLLQDSLGLRGDAASSYADLGTVALAQKKWTAAQQFCAQGWKTAEQLGDLKVQVKNGDCLYQAYRELKQSSTALAILEQTYALRDSFLSAENTRELQEIRERYEADRRALEMEVGPRTYQKLWLGVLGVLLATLFGFFLRRRRTADPATRKVKALAEATLPTVDSEVTSTPPNPPVVPATPGHRSNWAEETKLIIITELKKGKDVTTASLARRMVCSERQLLRRCKEVTGKTTARFIHETKLDYARTLITTSNLRTVAEVSNAVGFRSPNYFSRQFADRFGVRPADLLAGKS
ncbi:MAG: tetratricopeptide repeat protein [Bacteroidota bacterium]